MKATCNRVWNPVTGVSLLIAGALTFTQPAPAAPPVGDKPPVGKPAPDFTLPDLDGKEITLSKYKSKFVVLEWFSDECPFVQKHYNSNNMQSLQSESRKKGVVWLSICSSGPGKGGFHSNGEHKETLKRWHGHMTNFLVDADGKVGRIYGAKNTPTMYIIDNEGTLVYEGAIDDKPDTDLDSVKSAKNYVRVALAETMAGKPVTTSVTKAYG